MSDVRTMISDTLKQYAEQGFGPVSLEGPEEYVNAVTSVLGRTEPSDRVVFLATLLWLLDNPLDQKKGLPYDALVSVLTQLDCSPQRDDAGAWATNYGPDMANAARERDLKCSTRNRAWFATWPREELAIVRAWIDEVKSWKLFDEDYDWLIRRIDRDFPSFDPA